MSKRFNVRRAGFTLIEVLLVIGILVAMGTVGVVVYSKIKASADKDQTRILVDQTKHAVELYQMQMSALPTAEEGLGALITAPDDETMAERWAEKGPFLVDGRIPVDRWGMELKYMVPADTTSGAEFYVYSCGPNKADDNGGEDDIISPKLATE
jgi:general secretion pathway protein G